MLQCVAVYSLMSEKLYCVAGVLQCVVAVCCSMLQYVAVCCSVLAHGRKAVTFCRGVAVCCSVLQCVAVYSLMGEKLYCVAGVLQCVVAVCCSML